ncbi:NUDIX domain-containing protein [Candidatus Kaiserbacteria bacterium]|nr:NUDIX domain-containing protein [Candidatus Kaiserbacteria bacterium]
MNQTDVRRGTGVWIRKEGKLLLGRRKSARGDGTWYPPGGHVEKNETVEDCCVREVLEEVGLTIANIRLMKVMEDFNPEVGVTYVTSLFAADWNSGDVVMNDGEFTEVRWFEWGSLPEPLFRPTSQFVALGINPLEF